MKKSTHTPTLIWLCLTVIACVGVWIGWLHYVELRFPEPGPKTTATFDEVMTYRGQFGDLFGGINALFTAILLAAALIGLVVQQRQLKASQDQQIEALTLQATIAKLDFTHRFATELQADIDKGGTMPEDARKRLEDWLDGLRSDMGRDYKTLKDLSARLEALKKAQE